MHYIVCWVVYLALFVDRARALWHVLSCDHGARAPHEVERYLLEALVLLTRGVRYLLEALTRGERYLLEVLTN